MAGRYVPLEPDLLDLAQTGWGDYDEELRTLRDWGGHWDMFVVAVVEPGILLGVFTIQEWSPVCDEQWRVRIGQHLVLVNWLLTVQGDVR